MNILITGANGFIGSALLTELIQLNNITIRATTRDPLKEPLKFKNIQWLLKEGIGPCTDWHDALHNIDVVIHLAARAHVFHKKGNNELDLFREINTYGTKNLAEQAISAGVKRFIFISSIGVNGSNTQKNHAFQENSPTNPETSYAQSKLEAELELFKLSKRNAMDVVIIRPPLVYGEKAPGNFHTLLKIASLGIPLPFKNLNNKKSFISINNLINFIGLCTFHPEAANQLFLISDDDDLSTEEIIKYLSLGMNKKERLFSLPAPFIRIAAKMFGKERIYNQLYGSLQICPNKAKSLLQWIPQEKFSLALIETARRFESNRINS